MKRPYILLGLAVVAVICGWQPFGRATAGSAKPAPPSVAVASALGRVEPASRIRKVAPPDVLSNPRLEALLVQEGSKVKAGELLGWFAGRDKALAAVRRAEAALERAAAELVKVKAGAKSGELLAAEAHERRAAAHEAQTRRNADRARQLRGEKIVAASEAEQKVAELEIAQAELRAAQQNRTALAEVRAEDVAVAEAAEAEAHAAVAQARAEVSLQEIHAPISGTVLRVNVSPGEAADIKGVLELADLTAMNVVAEIYETDAAELREGQAAEILVPGRPERLRARVQQVGWMVKRKEVHGTDPVADIDSRVIEVRLRLDVDGARLLERMTNRQVQVIIAPHSTQLAAQ
jgi:HlyD family secretion protein